MACLPFHSSCKRTLWDFLEFAGEFAGELAGPSYMHLRLEYDKDLVDTIMQELHEPEVGATLSKVNYSRGLSSHGGEWICIPGQEFLAADPFWCRGMEAVEAIVESSPFRRSFLAGDLGSKVAHDPLVALPDNVLYQMSYFLPDNSLFDLCSASWGVHSKLRNGNQFWRLRMKMSYPWLWELHWLTIMVDEDPFGGKDAKAIFLALDFFTVPREDAKGEYCASSIAVAFGEYASRLLISTSRVISREGRTRRWSWIVWTKVNATVLNENARRFSICLVSFIVYFWAGIGTSVKSHT
ncbi:hypothetical protein B0H63DRAFT_139805 [Podospora didyma]|uniref:F-box domain-containing protein n=1 Tax=Podospora didyma TaxID=330526 RepID=A0AAE0NS61_9PEZI|nr:hypothetical protein B0H63DRAFT_139805 [Podospora didyma]